MLATVEPQSGTQTTPPPGRWRNYYRVYHVLHMGRAGHWFPGINAGPDDFPSQDVAETHGRALAGAFNVRGRYILEFAGAYPEDGKAN